MEFSRCSRKGRIMKMREYDAEAVKSIVENYGYLAKKIECGMRLNFMKTCETIWENGSYTAAFLETDGSLVIRGQRKSLRDFPCVMVTTIHGRRIVLSAWRETEA